MKTQNFQSAFNQPGANKYFDDLEQGKVPDFWKYFTMGMGIFGLMLLIATLIFLAHNQKNEQYKKAQIEYSKTAANDTE